MIDQAHYEAMKNNHDRMLKNNTQLNAIVRDHKSTLEQVVESSEVALKSMFEMYDNSNSKILAYLIKNNIIAEESERHHDILSLMPTKLGGNE